MNRLNPSRRLRRSTKPVFLAASLWVLILSGNRGTAEESLTRFEFSRIEMAVDFRVVLYGSTSEAANNAATAAFDRIRQLNGILSDYDSSSELMRLCATSKPGQPVVVSSELFEVLKHAQQVSALSQGAFDVSVGPLTKLWRRARRQKELPARDDLDAALKLVNYQAIRLHEKGRAVELMIEGMRLDLGGIAKGYASDQALAVLRQHGIRSALIAAAGDIAVGAAPPGKDAWEVAVESLTRRNQPDLTLRLVNQAVSTSGDAYQFVEIDGRRYSHIVDPKTGLGLTKRCSVTVVAKTGMQADALATAITVVGAEAGLKWLAAPNVGRGTEVLVQTLDEHGAVARRASPGFDGLIAKGR